MLLPMVDLIEQCQWACDELIDVTRRAAIQAVLQLSAEQVAGGPLQQGKRRSAAHRFIINRVAPWPCRSLLPSSKRQHGPHPAQWSNEPLRRPEPDLAAREF